MTKYESTIDWDDYWETHAPTDVSGMKQGGENMVDRFERFFNEFPDSFVSVGCGYAFTLFGLADRCPETTFVGVDISQPVIEKNRARTVEQGLENLTFKVGRLPDLNSGRTFECVYCYATLHYVADSELAVQRLYEHVQPGGALVFHYPNRYAQDSAKQTDSEEVKERFELVIEGKNLLTYDRIRDLLGRQPRSFWRAVGEDEWRDLGRNLTCVYIERPV